MGDGMSKDVWCQGCKHESLPYHENPCNICDDCDNYVDGSLEKVKYEPDGTNPPEKLVESHWKYVKSLLEVHGATSAEIKKAEFHYVTAFIHGYKHAKEDYGDDDTTT